MITDLGFWDINGNYIEDYQELNEIEAQEVLRKPKKKGEKMDKWIKIKEAVEQLKVSESFLRKIIYLKQFKKFIKYESPILINVNDDFCNKFEEYLKEQNIKLRPKKLIKEHVLERWTNTAIECYERGCNCSNCSIKKYMECECRMKKVVFELVKKLGAPIQRKEIL